MGVEGLTRSLSQELPAGMAAVAFNPGVINTDMLRSTFGEQASEYPSPQEWAIEAVNRLENLSATDNGKPRTHNLQTSRLFLFPFLSLAPLL